MADPLIRGDEVAEIPPLIAYYRLSGGGNDFLALVEPEVLPAKCDIAAWCRRGLSLGADGVLVLDRRGEVLRVRHFNADGGAAGLCLNGTRCAARLALELGWAPENAAFPITTAVGVLSAASVGQDMMQIELPVADRPPQRCSLEVRGVVHAGWEVLVGVPHLLLWVEGGLAALELRELGPALRYHPHFPDGTNVNWLEGWPGGFAIRTWERGVEAETLACGTGVLAATAAGIAAGRFDFPLRVDTRGGFVFSVQGESSGGRVRAWSLTGDARIVARGEILAGALAQPGI